MHGILQGIIFIGRISAARILLPVEYGTGVAERPIRSDNRTGLFCDSSDSAVVYPQADRFTLQLDVWTVRSIHRGVRRHACDGSVEPVAHAILACGSDQSDYRHGFRPYSGPTGPRHAAGGGASGHPAMATG